MKNLFRAFAHLSLLFLFIVTLASFSQGTTSQPAVAASEIGGSKPPIIPVIGGNQRPPQIPLRALACLGEYGLPDRLSGVDVYTLKMLEP